MIRKTLLLLVLGAGALVFSSCATCWSGGIPLRPTEVEGHRQALADFGPTDDLRIHKGLAHPVSEKRLYARQVERGGWIEVHGFKFEAEPAEFPQSTAEEVLDLYRDLDSHQAWGPKTKCAGFHPDWVLLWNQGERLRALQICYGCHEWKFFGPDGKRILSDISETAYFGPLTKLLPKEER